MAESKVKLLGSWGSPYSRRAEMGLKLKGVEYEFVEEDIKNKSSLLLESNPIHKKIPVLIHNGKPIAESLIILEYIDETWEGPSILPKDPYDRAMARFWVKFIDETCMPAIWKAIWSKGEEREKEKEEAIKILKFLENELKDKKFFGGDTIGLVDICANFIGHWFRPISELAGVHLLNEDNFPNLCRWAEDYTSDGFVKENLPAMDKLMPHIKARMPSTTGPPAH